MHTGALVDRHEIALRTSLSYTFTRDLTVELYAEPFAASGRFHALGEPHAPRSQELLEYGTDGTLLLPGDDGTHTVIADGDSFTIPARGFDVRSFGQQHAATLGMAPREHRLYGLQDRFTDDERGGVAPGALWDAVRADGDHFLALKVSYWLPVR